MSSSYTLCPLLSVKKQNHDFHWFFIQCTIIKKLLDSAFVISRIIKVSVRVISLGLRLLLVKLASTLIILDITKTSSNNCLLLLLIIPTSFTLERKPLFQFSHSNLALAELLNHVEKRKRISNYNNCFQLILPSFYCSH